MARSTMESKRTSMGSGWASSSRASSTTSPTRVVISSSWACTSAEQLGPVRLGQVLDPQQHLDVGAQAGERGAQLVAGVGDQLGLLLAGGRQGRAAWQLKDRASRASSSSPRSSMVESRSWVAATCSAAAVSRSTGPDGGPADQVAEADARRRCRPSVDQPQDQAQVASGCGRCR